MEGESIFLRIRESELVFFFNFKFMEGILFVMGNSIMVLSLNGT